MTYGTIYSIFDLMQDTLAREQDLYDDYFEYKNAGNMIEAEKINSLIKIMDTAINGYHQLIVNYVNSADALVDDFDEEINVFLENNKYYNYMEWYEYDYSDEIIAVLKEEIFSDFIRDLYSAVVDDDFYSSDEAIQGFINGFSKIDLYLYVINKS